MALGKNSKNQEAYFLMAKLYEEGQSVDKNAALAYQYYQKAAEFKFPKAFTKLGHYHYSGYSSAMDDSSNFSLQPSIKQAHDFYL